MKTVCTMHLRAFPVEIKDNRTGEKSVDTIVIDRDLLEKGQSINMNYEQIVCRLYNREGYHVISVGRPTRKTVDVDLLTLFTDYVQPEPEQKES